MPSFRFGDLRALYEYVGIARRNKGRCLARSGHLDLRSEAEIASALKSDTPPRLEECLWLHGG
jgi:hypothetical protein